MTPTRRQGSIRCKVPPLRAAGKTGGRDDSTDYARRPAGSFCRSPDICRGTAAVVFSSARSRPASTQTFFICAMLWRTCSMLCGASIRPAPRVATLWRCLGPKADMYIVNGVAPVACDAAKAKVEPFRLFSENGFDRVTPQTGEGFKHWVKFLPIDAQCGAALSTPA